MREEQVDALGNLSQGDAERANPRSGVQDTRRPESGRSSTEEVFPP